jgi:hypothetical protein
VNPVRSTEKESFLQRVRRIPKSGCWIWQGNISSSGYGRFKYKGKQELAHRASVRLFKEIYLEPGTKGGIVSPVCLNPLCVNPSHLEILEKRRNDRGVKKARWEQFRKEHPEEFAKLRKVKKELDQRYQEWLAH